MSELNSAFPGGMVPAAQYPLTDDGVIKVYSAGPVTVLGFGGHDAPSEFNAAHYRAAITDLIRAHASNTVAFDLSGVQLVPSGMLGLFVSLTRIPDMPLKVQVFNPSPEVREVLSLTRLDRLIELHQIDLGNPRK
jgi:anti-anti-sigma regulatory factor